MTQAERVLTLRELNRTTLARQMLLARQTATVPHVLERLVGLQAQALMAPFVGIWSRLQDFERGDLAKLITSREVVKVTLMRGTLHLCTSADFIALRGAIQPVLDRGYLNIAKQRSTDTIDFDAVLAEGKRFLAEKPRSFAELSEHLTNFNPTADVGAMRYSVRMRVPLVVVPTQGSWSYPGNPEYTLAETWLRKPIPNDDNVRLLVSRYLTAFGPATIMDIQTWSGREKLKAEIAPFKAELKTYRDEQKRELLDLPDLPIMDADTPAPVRFLPEFDNTLLSHELRTRIIADEYRPHVITKNLRVNATFLVDGFVAGLWEIGKSKKTAILNLQPFIPLTPKTQDELVVEGERLLRFVEPDAQIAEVRFSEAKK